MIDSGVNTVLQGMLVLEAVKMQKAGFGFQEAADKIEEIKGSGRIFFYDWQHGISGAWRPWWGN